MSTILFPGENCFQCHLNPDDAFSRNPFAQNFDLCLQETDLGIMSGYEMVSDEGQEKQKQANHSEKLPSGISCIIC